MAELIDLEAQWESLTSAATGPTIFQTWDWVVSWYEAFASSCDVRVLSAWDGEALVGVVPCSAKRIPKTPFRGLYLLGRGSALTEYCDALVARDSAPEVVETMVRALREQTRDWDLFHLDAVPDGSAFGEALQHEASFPVVTETLSRMVRPLPESWELFYRSLAKGMKENANNYVNRLRRAGHEERLVVATEPSELDGALDVFLHMHKTRAEANLKPPHRDRFATPAARDFLRTVAHRLLARGRIWPAVLEIDGRPIAAQLWLLLDKRAYRYYSGFDPAWARFGVMTVLTRRCIERAIESGFVELDLLLSRTDPKEKARWGASPLPVHSLTVGNTRLRSRAALRGYRVRTRKTARGGTDSSASVTGRVPKEAAPSAS